MRWGVITRKAWKSNGQGKVIGIITGKTWESKMLRKSHGFFIIQQKNDVLIV